MGYWFSRQGMPKVRLMILPSSPHVLMHGLSALTQYAGHPACQGLWHHLPAAVPGAPGRLHGPEPCRCASSWHARPHPVAEPHGASPTPCWCPGSSPSSSSTPRALGARPANHSGASGRGPAAGPDLAGSALCAAEAGLQAHARLCEWATGMLDSIGHAAVCMKEACELHALCNQTLGFSHCVSVMHAVGQPAAACAGP